MLCSQIVRMWVRANVGVSRNKQQRVHIFLLSWYGEIVSKPLLIYTSSRYEASSLRSHFHIAVDPQLILRLICNTQREIEYTDMWALFLSHTQHVHMSQVPTCTHTDTHGQVVSHPPRLLWMLIIRGSLRGTRAAFVYTHRLQLMRVTTGIESDEWKLQQLRAEWEDPPPDMKHYRKKRFENMKFDQW